MRRVLAWRHCHSRNSASARLTDYHYDNSPRDIQQDIFKRQLHQAVALEKPLTIHTREADEDVERILKEMVPKEHKVCRGPAQ